MRVAELCAKDLRDPMGKFIVQIVTIRFLGSALNINLSFL